MSNCLSVIPFDFKSIGLIDFSFVSCFQFSESSERIVLRTPEIPVLSLIRYSNLNLEIKFRDKSLVIHKDKDARQKNEETCARKQIT